MIFPMPNLSEKRIERTSFRNVLWPFSRKSARRPLSVLRLNLLDTKIIERSCVRNYPGCSHKKTAQFSVLLIKKQRSPMAKNGEFQSRIRFCDPKKERKQILRGEKKKDNNRALSSNLKEFSEE